MILFSSVIAGMFFWWGYNLQPVNENSSEKISFVVNKGDSLAEISENLKRIGLIKSPLHFRIYSLLLGTAKKNKAGSYYLSFSMTPREICLYLAKGADDQWVTIIEGLRSEQIGEIFIEKGFAVNLFEWKKQVKNQDLEGRLFPDSYLIPKGADQERILRILGQNFQKRVLGGLASELQKNQLSLEEVLTLASIVEREARHTSDRAIIAGILLNRLRDSWPLQVDASIQYAIGTQRCSLLSGSNCNWWPNSLSKDDLKINSPFNTYLNKGLPPGAICNPGLSSIKAVLQPEGTDYWFYVSDKNGIMHYARTSEEHRANVEKYLLTN